MVSDNIMKTDLMRYQESCLDFIDERVITRLLRVVKQGKEAVVVCCEGHPSTGCDYVAVKLYRERKFRNFRRDNVYHEGRIFDRRLMRAAANNTQVGLKVGRAIWTSTEYDTLDTLYDAGLRVPKPIAATDDAVAMQFVGYEDIAAPLLKHVHFECPEQARACYDELIDALDVMLRHYVVHGDLSPFNILYHEEKPWIIDMPQSVSPSLNPNAWEFFLRDVDHIVTWFSRWGVDDNAYDLARSIWEPLQGPIPCNRLMPLD